MRRAARAAHAVWATRAIAGSPGTRATLGAPGPARDAIAPPAARDLLGLPGARPAIGWHIVPSRMRVVIACNYPGDEKLGSSRTPLRQIDELRKLGVDVTPLFAEDLPELPDAPGLRSGRAGQLSAPARIAKALWARAGDADVVDIAGFDAWMYARIAHRLRPAQAIVCRSNGLWDRALATGGPATGRSALGDALSGLYQQHVLCRWERASFESADAALFLSRPDANEVVRRGWKTAGAVAAVNPGVDDYFASPVPLDQRRDVAFVGTFFFRKGSDVMAAAMPEVLRRRPDLRLALFGPGIPDDDARAAFPEDVRERVDVIRMAPPRELARALGRYAVFVLPTRYEGFGIVTLEAMRAGLAVAVTPTGAGADVVRDGENGLTIPVADADATAAAVGRLVDDPQLRMRLGHAAAEEASRHTWARAGSELLAFYERARGIAVRRAAARQ